MRHQKFSVLKGNILVSVFQGVWRETAKREDPGRCQNVLSHFWIPNVSCLLWRHTASTWSTHLHLSWFLQPLQKDLFFWSGYNTHGMDRKYGEILARKIWREEKTAKNLGVDGWVILGKIICSKIYYGVKLISMSQHRAPLAGCCENCNEHSDSIKTRGKVGCWGNISFSRPFFVTLVCE